MADADGIQPARYVKISAQIDC